MFPYKIIKKISLIALNLSIFFLISCSEKEEVSDYEKLGASSTDSGTIQGTVVDYSGGSGLSGVSITYSLSGKTMATTTTDSNGDYSQSSLPLGTYTISYSKGDYIASTQSGTLATNNQTLEAAKLTMLPNSCGSGYITGKIKDAVNGNNMGSVTLSARSGLNVTSGTVLGTATSADNGTYSLGSLSAGLYTVQTSKSNYISASFNVRLCGGASNQNANISKSLRDNQMRIILSWEGLEDFDSHLEIPCSPAGSSTIYSNDNCTGSDKTDDSHLYFGTNQENALEYDGVSTNDYHIYTDWVNDGTDNVTLDQDNRNGTCNDVDRAANECDDDDTGPETITINKLRDGSYRYHVHAYSQAVTAGTTNTRHIADNSTTVQICFNEWIESRWGGYGNCLTITPKNEGGNLWTVFDFWCIVNQTTHKPSCIPHWPNYQNKMSNESDAKEVDEH